MPQTQNTPIAAGIDIGSSAVRCVIGMYEEGAPAPSVVGVGTAPSHGVRKGTVVDIEETVSAITAAVDEAERISGLTLDGATINVNGKHVETMFSRGIIAVGSNNREITADDLSRAEEAATVMQLPPNREIIQTYPQHYTVDGQDHVKDPVGMSGMRLEVETCLVTASTPFLKNTVRSLKQAGGLESRGRIATPLAATKAVTAKQDIETGCVVVDIGAHTTGIAVMEEGELLYTAVLPIGSSHITNDIAIGLRTDLQVAESIKLKHVNVHPDYQPQTESINLEELNGEPLQAQVADVNHMAQARLEEIFQLVNKQLQRVKRDGMLPAGAILCGGGANLDGISEYAKQVLKLPAHTKAPHGFSGIVDKIQDPAYAAVVGLMLEDLYGGHSSGDGKISGVFSDLGRSITDILGRFRE